MTDEYLPDPEEPGSEIIEKITYDTQNATINVSYKDHPGSSGPREQVFSSIKDLITEDSKENWFVVEVRFFILTLK